jgi:hypothetical protein
VGQVRCQTISGIALHWAISHAVSTKVQCLQGNSRPQLTNKQMEIGCRLEIGAAIADALACELFAKLSFLFDTGDCQRDRLGLRESALCESFATRKPSIA